MIRVVRIRIAFEKFLQHGHLDFRKYDISGHLELYQMTLWLWSLFHGHRWRSILLTENAFFNARIWRALNGENTYLVIDVSIKEIDGGLFCIM